MITTWPVDAFELAFCVVVLLCEPTCMSSPAAAEAGKARASMVVPIANVLRCIVCLLVVERWGAGPRGRAPS